MPVHGVTWINLVNIMPSGRSESQWSIAYVTIIVRNAEGRQRCRDGMLISVCL